jgi:hypothetical protein
VKRRLPFLVMLGLGFLLWRGGFGWLAIERQLTWRLPVPYGDVRRLELQVWDGDTLVQRQEQVTPGGLLAEPRSSLPMTRGAHRAVASVSLADAGAPLTFQADFDPGAEAAVVLEWTRARAAGQRE